MWELQGCSIARSHQGQALLNTQQFAMESAGCSVWLLLPEGHRKDHRRSQGKTRLCIFRVYSKQSEYLSGRVTISFQRAEATCIMHL